MVQLILWIRIIRRLQKNVKIVQINLTIVRYPLETYIILKLEPFRFYCPYVSDILTKLEFRCSQIFIDLICQIMSPSNRGWGKMSHSML